MSVGKYVAPARLSPSRSPARPSNQSRIVQLINSIGLKGLAYLKCGVPYVGSTPLLCLVLLRVRTGRVPSSRNPLLIFYAEPKAALREGLGLLCPVDHFSYFTALSVMKRVCALLQGWAKRGRHGFHCSSSLLYGMTNPNQFLFQFLYRMP